jgi:hypothetical protein
MHDRTSNSSTSDFTQYRLQLCRNGYAPIPVVGKIPPMKEWEKRTDTSEGDIEIWAKTYRDAINTGIITRNTPAFDVDILNSDAAEAVEKLVRERFEERGHIMVRFGLAPKRLFPFRCKQPFQKIAVALTKPGGGKGLLEFLGDGQQFAVDGNHPDTDRPYRWHGGVPGSVKYEDLPEISADEAEALINDAADLLCRDFGYARKKAIKPRKTGNGRDQARDTSELEADPNQIAAALDDIPNEDVHFYDWLRVAMAAWRATNGSPVAFAAFDRWSQKSKKYDADNTRKKWWHELFRSPPDDIGAGTIFRMAREAQEEARARRWEKDQTVGGGAGATGQPQSNASTTACTTLADVHKVFRRWLGKNYDIETLYAVLATAAAEQLPGDPPWLMVISGPGNAKTETVQSVTGLGAHIVSTISSDGALLSASPRKEKAKNATGGLLRKIGPRGILVIKDFTSILSSNREVRSAILAALREIYDGRWVRNVGTDGGQTLEWQGRLVVLGACTTAWDAAHAVISTMGDRFVTIRPDSRKGRFKSGLRAIHNTGNETAMRQELADAVAGLVGNIDPTGFGTADPYKLTRQDQAKIVRAAELVTLARTGVELDYRGDVIDAHDPEAPTRLAKQLTQIMRGAIAIGMEHDAALRMVIRCARDSMPQLRLAVLKDLANHTIKGRSSVIEIRRRLQKPRTTIDRTLQALHILGLLVCEEEERERNQKVVQVRFYRLADGVSLNPLIC